MIRRAVVAVLPAVAGLSLLAGTTFADDWYDPAPDGGSQGAENGPAAEGTAPGPECRTSEEHTTTSAPADLDQAVANVVSRANVAIAQNVGRGGSSETASSRQTAIIRQSNGETEETVVSTTCVERR